MSNQLVTSNELEVVIEIYNEIYMTEKLIFAKLQTCGHLNFYLFTYKKG